MFLYAYDTEIHHLSPNLETAVLKINSNLQNISTWLRNDNLILNTKKEEAMIVAKKAPMSSADILLNNNELSVVETFKYLQSPSKVLGRMPFLPLLFLPPPAPGPMLIKTLMFVRVIVLLYPNIEQGGRGIFSKRENSLFSGLKWTTVKLYSLPNYFCL